MKYIFGTESLHSGLAACVLFFLLAACSSGSGGSSSGGNADLRPQTGVVFHALTVSGVSNELAQITVNGYADEDGSALGFSVRLQMNGTTLPVDLGANGGAVEHEVMLSATDSLGQTQSDILTITIDP